MGLYWYLSWWFNRCFCWLTRNVSITFTISWNRRSLHGPPCTVNNTKRFKPRLWHGSCIVVCSVTLILICMFFLSRMLHRRLWKGGDVQPRSRTLGLSLALLWRLFRRSVQRSLKFVMQPEKLLISRETWCYHCLLQKKKWCMFFYDFVLVTAASFSFVEQIVSHLESLQPSILPV